MSKDKTTEIFPKIKIVPMDKCLAHEGVVEKWVDGIVTNIQDTGVMKNPIIVTKRDPYYVVIDGMHRFAACTQLGLKDILVYEIDLFSEKVILEGWDGFIFSQFDVESVLKSLFLEKDGYSVEKVSSIQTCQKMVTLRQAILGGTDTLGRTFILKHKNQGSITLDELIEAIEMVDKALDEQKMKIAYVASSISLNEFDKTDAKAIIIRPIFTKEEIIDRTLQKKLFPRKSTKHIVPDRPLRVDLNLGLLRADVDLETKNQVLKEHLKWCYESDRVRFYPESVLIFSD